MANLRWDGDDFRNPQDSSGATAGLISHSGKLQQGYRHGSLTQGLKAYYSMDSGSGSTVVDRALGNDGTTDASWTTGKYGDALAFDNSDDAVELGNTINIPQMDNATLCFWAAHTEKGQDNHSTMYSESASGTETDTYFCVQYEGSDPKLDLHSNVGNIYEKTSYTIPFDGSWHHYAVRKQGDNFIVLVDGNKVGEWNLSFPTGASKTYIGERTPPANYQPIVGKMDEVRVYDRALSTPEIKALSDASKPPEPDTGDTLQ
jgi:hypothetical protein